MGMILKGLLEGMEKFFLIVRTHNFEAVNEYTKYTLDALIKRELLKTTVKFQSDIKIILVGFSNLHRKSVFVDLLKPKVNWANQHIILHTS